MKKFIISTETLYKALHKLSHAVNTKSIMPILGNIYCKVGNKVIELIASDMEITIHYRCECETSGEGFEFLVPFQLISKIVALNKKQPLSFSMEKKGIKITGENDVYELKSLEKVGDFPKLQELPKKTSMELDDTFIPLLTTAAETVAKENEKHPSVSKVLLELKEEETTIASTDGGYLVFSYSKKINAPAEDELLISPKVIKAIEGLGAVKLYWHSKTFAFENKDVTVIVTRPDMKFVNFRAIFPADFNSNLSINRHDLINTLEKCNINSDVFKTTVLKLKTGKGKVSFESNDADYGININVDMDATYEGPVDEIRFNAEKMLRLMNQVDYDEIELAIHEKNKAILFRSTYDDGYLGLLMPIFNK